MKQFAVCRLKGGSRQRPDRLVVNLQHDLLENLQTRIVAPLLELSESASIEHLTPPIVFDDRHYRVAFH
jgi:hypothetical protein